MNAYLGQDARAKGVINEDTTVPYSSIFSRGLSAIGPGIKSSVWAILESSGWSPTIQTGGNSLAFIEHVTDRSGSTTSVARHRGQDIASRSADESTDDRLAATQSAFGLTVTGLAGVLRVERPTIYAWLRGTSVPTPSNAARLQKVSALADVWLRACHGKPYPDLNRPVLHGKSLNLLLREEHLRTFAIEQQLLLLARQLEGSDSPAPRRTFRELARERGIESQADAEIDTLTGRRLGPEE